MYSAFLGQGRRPFLLPHKWFVAMHVHTPEQFASAVTGPPGACDAFWKCMAGTPFFQQHPALSPDALPMTIPVGLYGDGGAFSHQDPLLVLT